MSRHREPAGIPGGRRVGPPPCPDECSTMWPPIGPPECRPTPARWLRTSPRGRVRLDRGILEEPSRNRRPRAHRSEEHTSELQSLAYLVCRLLLEKKKKN